MWEGRTQDRYLRRYEMQHDGGVFAEHQYSPAKQEVMKILEDRAKKT
jgi:hypothetical protein